MPRHPMPKKNETILKLEGGYRKDRHENRNESAITTMLTISPPCPATIKTEYVRQSWQVTVPPLVYTNRIGAEDIPILEVAFRALDGAEVFQSKLDAMLENIDNIKSGDEAPPQYAAVLQLAGMVKNYRQQFVDIMRRFGATSQDRLTLLAVMAGVKKEQGLAEKMTE